VEFKELLKARYSCRRYLDKQVPAATIEDLVAKAQQAPSWGNTQPWKVYAAGGETALAIRKDLVQAFESRQEEAPDLVMPQTFSGAMMDRYRDLGRDLFKVLGISREDKDKRAAHYSNNYNAFGAPALVFVTVPADQTAYAAYDAGAFVANFCLAASDAGLGTCILAALARYPQVVRQHLPIPGGESLVIGLSLGYPEEGSEVNNFRSVRDPLEKVLFMKGVE
jgi:nitroreductase